MSTQRMNERIKELADLAQRHAEFTTPQGLEWLETFKDKFAELIVRECIDIVDVDGEFVSRPKIVGRIKEHFGVEE